MMNYLDAIIAKCVSAFFKRWRTRPPEAIAFMNRYYCQRLPLAIANKYRYHPVASNFSINHLRQTLSIKYSQ
ncbi:hypothetical protein [Nostoc sp.]